MNINCMENVQIVVIIFNNGKTELFHFRAMSVRWGVTTMNKVWLLFYSFAFFECFVVEKKQKKSSERKKIFSHFGIPGISSLKG